MAYNYNNESTSENTPHMKDGMPILMLAGVPDIGWKNASIIWGSSWTGSIYSTIVINALLIIWTLINMIYILTKGRKLVSRKYILTLNLMVWIFAVTKLLFYAIDPRSINGVMPQLAGSLLLNTNFPTLTVGFCMLYVALRQCTIPNKRLLPLLLQTKCITIFIALCFIVSYSTDIAVALAHSMQLMMLMCQMFYILWALLFSVLYTALFLRYKNAVRKARKKMERSCYRRGHCRRGFSKRSLQTIPVCVKITCITATLFLLYAVLTSFLVSLEIGLYKGVAPMQKMCDKYRNTWTFFIVQQIFSLVEHLMAIMLAVAGTQPLKWLRLASVATSNAVITLRVDSDGGTMPNIFSIERDMETSFSDTTSAFQSQQTLQSSSISIDQT